MEQPVQTDRVADYLADLRPHLDDLDPSERAEVLDELADALREVAAENDGPLRDVLGPPAEYVAAYRASAGLAQGQPQRPGRLRTLFRTVSDTMRAQPWWPHVQALAHLLRPAWWTLRGAVLAVLVGNALGIFSPAEILSFPGLLCVTAAVAASLAIGGGRRVTKGRRVALAAANVIAVVTALSIGSAVTQIRTEGWAAGYDAGLQEDARADVMGAGQLTLPDGDLVTNIHPYTRDGEPLRDVLLFDDAGQPLNLAVEGDIVVGPDGTAIENEYERDAAGRPITNLYPLQQFTVDYDDKGLARRQRRTAPTIVLPPSVRSDATDRPLSDDSPTADASEPAAGGGAAPEEGVGPQAPDTDADPPPE
jgi:hypothetical protein